MPQHAQERFNNDGIIADHRDRPGKRRPQGGADPRRQAYAIGK